MCGWNTSSVINHLNYEQPADAVRSVLIMAEQTFRTLIRVKGGCIMKIELFIIVSSSLGNLVRLLRVISNLLVPVAQEIRHVALVYKA